MNLRTFGRLVTLISVAQPHCAWAEFSYTTAGWTRCGGAAKCGAVYLSVMPVEGRDAMAIGAACLPGTTYRTSWNDADARADSSEAYCIALQIPGTEPAKTDAATPSAPPPPSVPLPVAVPAPQHEAKAPTPAAIVPATQPPSHLSTTEAAPGPAATPPSSGPATPAAPAAQAWHIYAGEYAVDAIRRWAKQAGYTPVPDFAARDKWKIIVSQEKAGSFEEALAWLATGFPGQSTRPEIVLHTNHTLDVLSVPTGLTAADAGLGRFH